MAIDNIGHSNAPLQIQFTPVDIENLLNILKLGFKATDESVPTAYHEGFYNAVKSLLAAALKGLQETNQPALFKKVLHAIKIIESIPIIIMIQNDSPLVSSFTTVANKLRQLDESIDTVLKNIDKLKHKNDAKGG
jgi:hypothetical protein